MQTELALLKAADGATATTANVALCSPGERVGRGTKVTYHVEWGAGMVGTFKVRHSGQANPAYNGKWFDTPADLSMTTGAQPAGTAGWTDLVVEALADYVQLYYEPTSGGEAVLPTVVLNAPVFRTVQ